MDIVRFRCGLGNQMFQYALYQVLKSKGRTVKASLGYYENHPDKMRFSLTEVFPRIELDCISDREFEAVNNAWKKIKCDNNELNKFLRDYQNRFFWVDEKDLHYQPEIFETQNCTFVGYWQSEKYFCNIRDVLLKDFEFSQGENKLENFCRDIMHDQKSIAVHIRRGDYRNNPKVWGNLSESGYYHRAIQYMKENISHPRFIFFSDDISWVKEHYNYEDAVYIECSLFDNYESWYDMRLMSCCAHIIIANSSFSWWGAWLNRNENGIIIAPRKWLYNTETPDIWCDNWVRM